MSKLLPTRVDTAISHKVMASLKVWEEAQVFYQFILDNHLSHIVRTRPDDAHWPIFFVQVVRYIAANQHLAELVSSDDDIPF